VASLSECLAQCTYILELSGSNLGQGNGCVNRCFSLFYSVSQYNAKIVCLLWLDEMYGLVTMIYYYKYNNSGLRSRKPRIRPQGSATLTTWHVYPLKLVLTSRTQATEFSLFLSILDTIHRPVFYFKTRSFPSIIFSGLSWFSSIPPGKFLVNALSRFRHPRSRPLECITHQTYCSTRCTLSYWQRLSINHNYTDNSGSTDLHSEGHEFKYRPGLQLSSGISGFSESLLPNTSLITLC
jgi:hypothetical protein